MCRIHRKLGVFDEIFPKNWKFRIISYKSKLKINIVGRKIQKIGFYGKTSTNFQSFSLQLIAQITNCCRTHQKNKNLPNSSPYTIQNKIVRNSHVLSQNLAFFSSATTIVLQTSANCSHTKFSKQQLTAHTSIVKRIMAKCYKHAPLSSKSTIVVTGVSKSTNIHAQITKQINLADIVNYNINIYNGSFFSYKKQRFHRFIQLTTAARYEETLNNDMRNTKRFLSTRWKEYSTK